MKYSDKKILLKEFQDTWGKQFEKIPNILKYLSTYPAITKRIEGFLPMIEKEEMIETQLEWVSWVAQLDHPIETEFFKNHWVSISKKKYNYFFDLSSEKLPLFEVGYFSFEPHQWYKKYIFNDLHQFLKDIDHPKFDVKQYFEQIKEEGWEKKEQLFDERDKLGFAGKLTDLLPIQKNDIFIVKEESDYSIKEESVTFNWVTSIIACLLPNEAITLRAFSPLSRKKNIFDSVKNIEALVYLIKSEGSNVVYSYFISFNSNKGGAYFEDHFFKLIHADKEFLKGVIDKYEMYKNS